MVWPISPAVFTPQGMLNPVVVAFFAIILTQIAKASFPDGKWKPIATLVAVASVVGGIELVIALTVAYSPDAYVTAALLTVFGTACSVFGYETVKSLAKALGLWKGEE